MTDQAVLDRIVSANADGTWPVPPTLSPSRVEAFLSCPLQFRFASIEKLPEPPSVAATRGSAVHRALELFFVRKPSQRTPGALDRCVDAALNEYASEPDYVGLALDADAANKFRQDCVELCANYLTLEDPTTINAIGLELRLEAPVGDLSLRGVIDRLDRTTDGKLIVTDYKTGRAPSQNWERKSLSGVHFYAFMCESIFGQRPDAIRLMYLKSGEIITATPTAQSTRFMQTRTKAVHQAVTTACERNDFRARQGPLCNYCAFQRWCPEFGGRPDDAAAEAPSVYAVVKK